MRWLLWVSIEGEFGFLGDYPISGSTVTMIAHAFRALGYETHYSIYTGGD